MREESRERPAERALQTADAAHRAGRGRGSHAFDQPVQILELAHHRPDPDLAGLARQRQPAAAPALRADIAKALQPLGDLGEVVARNAILARTLVDRHLATAARQRHRSEEHTSELQYLMRL